MIEPETGLRTGQLAARAGINIQTLRYYERRRLLAPPVRRPSGQRTYPETAVALLRCIKGAQRLGFTLTEIEDLLALAAHRRGTDELHRRTQIKLAEIEARIADLQQIRANLQVVLTARCDSLTRCSCGMGSGLPLDNQLSETPCKPTRRRDSQPILACTPDATSTATLDGNRHASARPGRRGPGAS